MARSDRIRAPVVHLVTGEMSPEERDIGDSVTAEAYAQRVAMKLEQHSWTDEGPLPGADRSGFGRVRLVTNEAGMLAVAKLIPAKDGRPVDREVRLALDGSTGARNVMPVLDSGRHEGEWVIVMPRAKTSLARHLEDNGPLSVEESIRILQDVATALADLVDVAVHRDIKPENILKLGESWYLTDFGIARMADEATGTMTWKGYLSERYAAPETFLFEHATPKTDMYSLGVVAFEMLEGRLPFPGPDFHQGHRHEAPPAMKTLSPHLRAAVNDALNKDPGTRPTPQQFLARLARAAQGAIGGGANALAAVDAKVAEREAKEQAEAAKAAHVAQTKQSRANIAAKALGELSEQFIEYLEAASPRVRINRDEGNTMLFVARLEHGSLGLQAATESRPWTGPFDVVSHASIVVRTDQPQQAYEGRSHSLWYCDAHHEGEYAWFETAFMDLPLAGGGMGSFAPQALEPAAAEDALNNVFGITQLAWPFEEIDHVAPDEFLDSWVTRFARAAAGNLPRPMTMPEKHGENSYRPRRPQTR